MLASVALAVLVIKIVVIVNLEKTMGFFKALAYVAGGVGAVILAPVTGGSSIAVAIGALGTTTLAGAAIGAGIGATAAAIDYVSTAKEEARQQGLKEGAKAGKREAQRKYEKNILISPSALKATRT